MTASSCTNRSQFDREWLKFSDMIIAYRQQALFRQSEMIKGSNISWRSGHSLMYFLSLCRAEQGGAKGPMISKLYKCSSPLEVPHSPEVNLFSDSSSANKTPQRIPGALFHHTLADPAEEKPCLLLLPLPVLQCSGLSCLIWPLCSTSPIGEKKKGGRAGIRTARSDNWPHQLASLAKFITRWQGAYVPGKVYLNLLLHYQHTIWSVRYQKNKNHPLDIVFENSFPLTHWASV